MPPYERDDELADALATGAPDAFQVLTSRFLVTLIKFAVSRGFSQADAAILAQESLEEAYFQVQSFKRGASLRSWIVGIELNLMRREWRRRGQLDEVSLEELLEAGKEPSAQVVPRLVPRQAQRLARFWARYQLYHSLINPTHAAAVELRYLGQLSYQEVAKALGLKNEAVARVYVQRGLKALKLIDQMEAPEEQWGDGK
jgi:RNA polymerase sigma factor (sigma-70 family)